MFDRGQHRAWRLELFHGAGASLLARLAGAGLGFAWSLLLARFAGPEGSGIYYLALSLLTIVSTLGMLGLDQVLVRMISSAGGARAGDRIACIYRIAVAVSLTVAAGLSSLVLLIGPSFTDWMLGSADAGNLFALMSLGLPALALISVHSHALQGLRDIVGASVTQSVVAPALFVCGGLMMGAASSPRVLGLVFLVGTLGAALFGIWRWRMRRIPGVCSRFAGVADLRAEIVASASPLLMIAMLNTVIGCAPTLLLGLWHPPNEVGVFGAAYRVSMLLTFCLAAVNAIAAPMFASLHRAADRAQMARIARMASAMALLASIPAIVLTLVAPGWIMGWFGAEFEQGSGALMILVGGQTVNLATGTAGSLLVMCGREGLLLRVIAVGAVLNLSLGMALIPGYGIIGAAVCSAVALAAQNLLAVALVRRRLGIRLQPWPVRGQTQ